MIHHCIPKILRLSQIQTQINKKRHLNAQNFDNVLMIKKYFSSHEISNEQKFSDNNVHKNV